MENNIFEKWDSTIGDMESIQKDIQDAASNNGGNKYKEVPHGTYDVSIEKMELVESKTSKKPMVSVWMKIVSDGEFKDSLIFMNQVIDLTSEFRGLQVHSTNEFLRSLIQKCFEPPVVEFKSFVQYADLLMDIHEMIADSFEYALEYGVTKKGYDTFKIREVYELESDDLPF
jgi:hypothetical protein